MIYNLQVSFLSLLNSTPILDSNTNTELEKNYYKIYTHNY